VILQQWLSDNLAALRCLQCSVEKLSFLCGLLYIRLYVDDGEQQGEVSYSRALVACLDCFQYHVSFFDVVDCLSTQIALLNLTRPATAGTCPYFAARTPRWWVVG
jgi:hypothetical protein